MRSSRLLPLLVALVAVAGADAQARLLVPLYSYPGVEDPGAYARVAAQSAVAPIAVVVNPCSGPAGPTAPSWCTPTDDAQHRLALDTLRSGDPSLRVLGYVATGYLQGEGPDADAIRADIDAYVTHYSGAHVPDGLFFDEVTNGAGTSAIYRDLCLYAKSKGFEEVVLNPGAPFASDYLSGGACDAGVAFEDYPTGGLDWPSFEIGSELAPYTPDGVGVLIHDLPESQTVGEIETALDRGFGLVYVTDDVQAGGNNPWNQLADGFEAAAQRVAEHNAGLLSIVVDGARGSRFFGPPALGVTVDDLAAQNLVRGVPGYYPAADPPNLFTTYDASGPDWVVSSGTGEVLELGKAFRWYMFDRVIGNPEVSASVELPFTLTTDRPANTTDVTVELDTSGTRFNYLANPFGADLDLAGIESWPGGDNLSSIYGVEVYDDGAETWVAAPASVGPWVAFRVRSKGPRTSGTPRTLTIPASASGAAGVRRGAPTASARGVARLAFALSGTGLDGRPLADRSFAVAFTDAASAALDASDAPKTAPVSEAYALLGARVGGQLVGLDARPFAPATLPLAVDARGAEAAFTLSWDGSALPGTLPVVLVDLATGAEVDVRARSSYAFEVPRQPARSEREVLSGAGASAVDRFVLRIGDALAAAERAAPEVALSAIAPNPFASSARVTFSVPDPTAVRVTVVDVRGREVAVLLDGPVGAGRHEATLDAGRLAAGVYVVRLEAAGQVVTRQAAVVR